MPPKVKISPKFCKGSAVRSYIVDTPIATFEIVSCIKGLHELNLKKLKEEIVNSKDELIGFDNGEIFDTDKIAIDAIIDGEIYEAAQSCADYLKYYFNFNNEKKAAHLPDFCWQSICKSPSFTETVLKSLVENVKVGETISYKNLAAKSGSANATRAVGSIMKRNPLILLIPCHRVIKQDKQMGNYSCGQNLKRWFLQYESQK